MKSLNDYSKDAVQEIAADKIDNVRKRVRTDITGICNHCTHSHIYRTPRMNTPVVICDERGSNYQVPIDISECNRFTQQGVLSIWELAKLAIDIDLTTKPQTGFRKE
jgi:hypothetical protein